MFFGNGVAVAAFTDYEKSLKAPQSVNFMNALALSFSMYFGNGKAVITNFDKGIKALQTEDYKTALAVLTPLAEQGYISAQYNLGLMYSNGEGVWRNKKTAVKWYTLAAEQGLAAAQFRLGEMYQHGRGVSRNTKTMFKWYTLAAEQGHAKAQFKVGVNYWLGREHLSINYTTAVKWYTRSAKQGLSLAQDFLGGHYERGEGVPTDYVQAYMWYSIAAHNGQKSGDESKERISKNMTAAQISQAQEMVSRCLESDYTDC